MGSRGVFEAIASRPFYHPLAKKHEGFSPKDLADFISQDSSIVAVSNQVSSVVQS
jgi:hypothetical protein